MEQKRTCPSCGRQVPPGESVCRCGFRFPDRSTDEEAEQQPDRDRQPPESVDLLPPGPWEEMRDEKPNREELHTRPARRGRLLVGVAAACAVALAGYMVGAWRAPERRLKKRILEEGVSLTVHRVEASGRELTVCLRADRPTDRDPSGPPKRMESDVARTLTACMAEQRFDEFHIRVETSSTKGANQWLTALTLDCSRPEAERALQEQDPALVLRAAGAELDENVLNGPETAPSGRRERD